MKKENARRTPGQKPARAGSAPAAKRGRGGEGGLLFPIVGIGTSAGGLEALEAFLRHVPEESGLAFVVVQHLDPNQKGMLAELLQRVTPMKVLQIKDRARVEPNRVYVIPPNKELSILHGVLHLLAPAAPRGQRLPIDFFFRALATDRKNRSIGVILSGMGSDGTLGVRAVKEQAGAVFVQEPGSAKFASMPRSAIDAGLADVVAPAEELPGRILAYAARAPRRARPGPVLAGKTLSSIEKICVILRRQTGHDFSLYKRSTIHRRIERRMGLHQIDDIAAYVRHLQESPQEGRLLLSELLIGVTSFFRDPTVWERLATAALPALMSGRSGGGPLRAWVPGCSTGEEAYSLAIAFREAQAALPLERRCRLQIFATDLDRDAVDRARQGLYPANIASDVSPERLQRFFAPEEGGYRIRPEIRETVIFAQQNVISDPPFTKLDLLSCRNLLIYLAPELQKRLLSLFRYSLNPGGILVLGSAETAGTGANLFAPVDGKARIFRRIEAASGAEPVDFPSSFHARPAAAPVTTAARAPAPNLQDLADRFLKERFAPAAVLTTAQGDILYVSGRTGRYLEPAAGKANWNLHAMARAGLRHELGDAFRKALAGRSAVVRTGVQLEDGAAVDVTIEPLEEPEAMRGTVMVVFADSAAEIVVAPPRTGRRAPAAGVAVERELRRAREELQSTREEMQSSQEELKSANEELQSTNEELQSTNEELTTSKEEMQSLNEELQTLNHELQAKVDELSRASDDMRNLLNSTDIATLFLDDALKVRRFTAQMTKIVKLIPGDVGRPITDLASDLVYPDLAADAQAVLTSLAPREAPVATVDGRWFSVRIMPYRTMDNRIDGVVITFIDITAAKRVEAELRRK